PPRPEAPLSGAARRRPPRAPPRARPRGRAGHRSRTDRPDGSLGRRPSRDARPPGGGHPRACPGAPRRAPRRGRDGVRARPALRSLRPRPAPPVPRRLPSDRRAPRRAARRRGVAAAPVPGPPGPACHRAPAEPHADVLLALDGDTLIGLASVYAELPSIRFGRRCWLEDLVVTSSRRGQGIGRRLLEAAAEWGRAHGCVHLELSSANTRGDAHRFYLGNGMAQNSLLFGRLLR